ncbi:MAG: hypothetical protein ACRC6M_16685, partial [Microcystaceae cyanobacterium]
EESPLKICSSKSPVRTSAIAAQSNADLTTEALKSDGVHSSLEKGRLIPKKNLKKTTVSQMKVV